MDPTTQATLFSSASSEWSTPQSLFDHLDSYFHFTTDVCATAENAKCKRFFTIADDGLAQIWAAPEVYWMNPPYGRGVDQWVRKAVTSVHDYNARVVCLLPARTDTEWWHAYCMAHASAVWFLRGRLRFGAPDHSVTNSAPFPSAVVVFEPEYRSTFDRHRLYPVPPRFYSLMSV